MDNKVNWVIYSSLAIAIAIILVSNSLEQDEIYFQKCFANTPDGYLFTSAYFDFENWEAICHYATADSPPKRCQKTFVRCGAYGLSFLEHDCYLAKQKDNVAE